MSAVNRFIQRRALPGVLPTLAGVQHPVLQRLYISRGITDMRELERGAAALLPFNSLKGIDAAVELLVQALSLQQ
ncbi:MAG TPA: single-stranded-DNA-specific exonuclease RecJ, partial [Rheinheimera sp.]|nr:single-stranded-DNA-specific exonuclease RecJ [Rheinheimera sp.]